MIVTCCLGCATLLSAVAGFRLTFHSRSIVVWAGEIWVVWPVEGYCPTWSGNEAIAGFEGHVLRFSLPHIETTGIIGVSGWKTCDRQLVIPLWMFVVASAVATGVVWWRGRGAKPGSCHRCGYNLTGNVSGICPECGTPVRESGAGTPSNDPSR